MHQAEYHRYHDDGDRRFDEPAQPLLKQAAVGHFFSQRGDEQHADQRDGLCGIEQGDSGFDVNQERGLFKIVALYLKDRLDKSGETKTIAEYYNAEESETLCRGLDLATILAQGTIIGPIMSAVGVTGLAVGLALYVADYGVSRLFDRNIDRKGDDYK